MNQRTPPPHAADTAAVDPQISEQLAARTPPYQRLRNITSVALAEGSRSAVFEREILTAVAEMIDADSMAFIVQRNGSLTVTELALDARHQGQHANLATELRMAASEALRGPGCHIEPSTALRNAVAIASALPDRSGAVAAIMRGNASTMANARAVLELAALALGNARGGDDSPLGKALTRISKEMTSPEVTDDVALSVRLRAGFGARQAIVGMSSGRILAMAPVSTIQPHSPTDRMMEVIFFRAWSACRPVVEHCGEGGSGLAEALNARTIVAFPLDSGNTDHDRIALLVEPDLVFDRLDTDEWTLVHTVMRSETRISSRPSKSRRRFGNRSTLAVAVILGLILLIPLPDRIRANATLEPDGRRYVVANFAAVLKDTKAAPGDIVKKGELVASLEGEALRLERTAAAAKAEEARRKEDAALREKKITQAALARIDGKAATAQRDLLDWQIGHLELHAPVDGVVLSNQFEHSAGAPVREGDTIMEIAPVNQMRVRVEVPVTDLQRIPDEPQGRLYLDGVPGDPIELSDFSRAARAETINGKTVIPLRTTIDNPKRILRPGQVGIAILPTGRALLGEILFRDAWNAFRKWWL